MIGILGYFRSSSSRNFFKGAFAGATISEWKAWDVGRTTQLNPLSSNADIASLTAGVEPAITVILGEFLFAAITYPSIDSITSATSSYGAVTLAINPLSSISTDPISVPRAAAARKAESISIIPEAIKAAYSPSE